MYTVLQLITDAFYLSQIVSLDLQTAPTGSQIEVGLNRLNGFIGNKTAKTKLIPFYERITGNLVSGQEEYFFPRMVHIETFTFFIPNPDESNAVRFNTHEDTRYKYFATARAEGIKALPYRWRQERVFGGTNFYTYFLPLENYAYEMLAKFYLDSVTLNQDLDASMEISYREYLLYGLTTYLCQMYDAEPPLSVVKQFDDLEADLMTQSPMDLTIRKTVAFSGSLAFNYLDADGLRGYRPMY